MTKLRNLTYDFVRRTKQNLATIERLAEEEPNKHFEVTQLINSSVGMLFVPTEGQIDRLNKVRVEDFLEGIHPPQVLFGELKHDNAAGLVRYLRNAFAHLNFDFEYANNSVQGIYVWNEGAGHQVNWVAYLRVEDLREILDRLTDYFLKVLDPRDEREGRLSNLQKKTGREFRLTNPTSK